MHTQGHLLGLGRVEKLRVVLQVNLDQPLLTLIADHIGVLADELHRFGIAKAHQVDTPQDLAVQGQFNQFGVLIGHGKQALAHRVVGQRRDIIIQALNHLGFQHHLIVRQANGAFIQRLAPGLPVEPGALE